MPEIAMESVEKLLKRTGIGSASDSALERLVSALEERAREIGFEAMMLARQAGRKDITEEDIRLALQ